MNSKEQAEFEELEELLRLYEEAIAKQEIIQLSEEEFEEIIHHYLHVNEPQSALDASEMALRQFPFSSEFCLTKADAHLELGNFEVAENLLLNNFKIDKTDIDYYIILSEVYLMKNDYDKAVMICEEGLEICESDQDTLLLHLAEINDYQGEYQKMIPLLEKCLRLNKDNEDALYLYSITMNILDRVDDKIDFLIRLIDSDPFHVNAWFYLGNAYKELGLYEKAIDAFEYIAAIEEDNNAIMTDMSQVYLESGQAQKAIDILHELEKNEDMNPVDYLTMGLAYFQIGNHHKAKSYIKDALAYDELADEAYHQLAYIFYIEKKYQASLPLINKALEGNEDMIIYLELKSDILYELGDLDNCLKIYERLIQLTSAQPYYISKLAYITSVLYGLDEAIAILNKGIEDYQLMSLYYYKSILYFVCENEMEGFLAFQMGLENDFDNHSILFEKIPELAQHPKIQLLLAHYGG